MSAGYGRWPDDGVGVLLLLLPVYLLWLTVKWTLVVAMALVVWAWRWYRGEEVFREIRAWWDTTEPATAQEMWDWIDLRAWWRAL